MNTILPAALMAALAAVTAAVAGQTAPASRPVTAELPAPQRTWRSLGHTAYYVDSQRGDDANDGKSQRHPWRTLGRVNTGTFGPGDQIRLRAGSRWTGYLSPAGSGAAGQPIILTSYGAGPKPQVDAQGQWLATLFLSNGEYWEISGLDIANKGRVPEPKLTGVQVSAFDFGTAHGIRLRDLDVHDVTGSNVKSEGGGAGINCVCGGDKIRSRFDGLLIENCHLARTDRNGITMGGNWVRNDSWFPSLHVVIRGNVLEDIGGDGIVPLACDGALVERNVLRGGRRRAQDYAAGIWPWSCDNTVIQYNEVSGMKGTNDGEGYDSDYNCRHTLFQYNLSHDNDGGFMLICDDGSQSLPWNIGNQGTVIRYNISVNDGLHTFNITGPCQDTLICNNTFYIGKGRNIAAVASGNWGGSWPDDTRFVNNLFYAGGQAKFDFGGMKNTAFDHNAFWGDLSNRPDDPHAVLTDPKLAAPGSDSPRAYVPHPGSPCLRAGMPVADNGGRDFWGHPLPSALPPDIGASQHP
ncbi:MAG: right-handed parallel beta-helix repeat-containing protein [Armatimonadetes bacterium]|nr:right-handed parallel beta-helix repeat-containing protein [Armatimonadota bacterium]